MRKIVLFIFLNILMFVPLMSQKTYVPDDNFEQILINRGYDSGPLDDSVTTSHIDTITNLNLDYSSINNLKGIEDFAALRILNCSWNQFDSLDFSMNLALEEIICNGSGLKSIDVSMNLSLTNLFVSYNSLTSLDVTANTSLLRLGCTRNRLDSIDLSMNANLTHLWIRENSLKQIDILANFSLEYLNCEENQIDSLDLSNNVRLTFLNCKHNNLRILDLSNDTIIANIDLSFNDLRELNIKNGNNSSITNITVNENPSLKCIQVDDTTYSKTNWNGSNFIFDPFVSFTYVICNPLLTGPGTYIPDVNFRRFLGDMGYQVIGDSVLTSDIDTITRLNVIGRRGKKIKDLKGIEGFIALTRLGCGSNKLRYLDLSNNTALSTLYCDNNQLDSIDLSNNHALLTLYCNNNQLDSIDLSNNTSLNTLNCHGNNLNRIDLSTNVWLKSVYLGNNQLKNLSLSNNTALTYVDCSYNQLDSLDVSNNSLVTGLACNNNRLDHLNLINNTALIYFDCSYNNLTNLNLLNNTALGTLIGFNNKLVTLNLSANTILRNLSIQSNQLRNLNLANGNNHNSYPGQIIVFDNPNLYCIQVDSVNYSNVNWVWSGLGGRDFHFDSIRKYSLDCTTCHAHFGKTQPTVGQVTLIDSTYGNNLKYTWYFGDGDSSYSYLPTHNYASAGTYNVCLFIEDSIGNCFDYFCDSITVDTSGILRNAWVLNVIKAPLVGFEEFSSNTSDFLLVYPNPATEMLNIDFDKGGEYNLYSIDGRIIQKGRLKAKLTRIDISSFETGVYLLMVNTSEGNIITKRVLKQ